MLVKQIIQLIYLNNDILNLNVILQSILDNILNKIYELNKLIENDTLYTIIIKKINNILDSINIKQINKLYNFLQYLTEIECKHDFKSIKNNILNYN